MTTKLDDALALAGMGFKVFPIAAGAKFPPLVNDWPRFATSDVEDADLTWGGGAQHNIGIHCEGLLVLDVDVKGDGASALRLLDMTYGEFPATLTTLTPTGGCHLFYRLPEGHPGVPNTVRKLGPGLDTRSTNGYVVAPGSEVPAGVYKFEADVPIAPAPQWLLELLGRAVARLEPQAVPHATPEAVLRASDWLARAEPAVEGQGGDLHTFKTAARLRDFGVSPDQAFELIAGEWNQRCSPPWSHDDLMDKVRNAYSYAQEEQAGKLAVTDDDFAAPGTGAPASDGTLSPAGPAAAKVYDEPEMLNQTVQNVGTSNQVPTERRGPEILSAFASGGEPARYLIKGVLTEKAYAVMYGLRSAGKTFTAMDMAYSIAAGKEWMGRRTHQAPVLWLPYEGAGGMRKRAEALRRHYGTGNVPFYIDSSRYNLREQAGRQALGRAIASMPAVPKLIVIDTFAHALMGGDENSAQDVGAFNSAIQALIERTGACVMVLHHPAKSGTGGPRGSGALAGAVDIELEVLSDLAGRRIQATKQRDFDLGDPIGFKLVPIIVGTDEDGEDVTSCVVLPREAAGRFAPEVKLNGKYMLAWEALCTLSPDNTPVQEAEWRIACEEFVDTRKSSWPEVKSRLKRLIVVEDGLVRRKLE